MEKISQPVPIVPIEPSKQESQQELIKPVQLEPILTAEKDIVTNYVPITKPIVHSNEPYLFYKQNNITFNWFVLTHKANLIESKQGENYEVWCVLEQLELSQAITSNNDELSFLFKEVSSVNSFYKKRLLEYLKEKFSGYLMNNNSLASALAVKKLNLVSSNYFWIGSRIEYAKKNEFDELVIEIALNMIPNTNLFSQYTLSKVFNWATVAINQQQCGYLLTFSGQVMETFLACFQKYIPLEIYNSIEYGTSFVVDVIEKQEYDGLLSYSFIGNNYKIKLYFAKDIKTARLNYKSYVAEPDVFYY